MRSAEHVVADIIGAAASGRDPEEIVRQDRRFAAWGAIYAAQAKCCKCATQREAVSDYVAKVILEKDPERTYDPDEPDDE